MSPVTVTVIVLAKTPVAGRVKTRCTPPCSPTQAADLAMAALVDTLDTVGRSCADRVVVALDGAVGPWIPGDFDVLAQVDGSLGQRIDAALGAVGGTCLLIGMDTPQVTVDALDNAITRLRDRAADSIIGLSTDGGFWALGVAADVEVVGLCAPVAMSLATTGADQLGHLVSRGLTVSLLATMTDVDDFATALEVAAAVPNSGFAAAVCAIDAANTRTQAGAA